MGIQKNPKPNKNQDDDNHEDEERTEELRLENEALRIEAAEVDRQLEAAQVETARLMDLLKTREGEVQALRGRVMRQRAERALRLAAYEAEEAMESSSEEQKAEMQKKLDELRCFELKTHLSNDMRAFRVCSDLPNPITKLDLFTALESVRNGTISSEEQWTKQIEDQLEALESPNVKILEKLDLAIEDAKKNQEDAEKVNKEVEMLQQMKKDIKEMEDVSASNDALMRMYKHLIEIANKTIRDPTSPIEAMFDADACRDVLKSKLSNLIELMELEKKYPEFQNLGSLIDGLSVSDTVGESNDTAGASGILGAIKKIFEK